MYVDGAPRPYAAFTGKLISIEGRPSTGYTMLISTDGGDEVEVVVRRAGGCGCGNRLKGFSPPYHLRYNARSA